MQPPTPGSRSRSLETCMLDLVLLAAIAAFFVLGLAYVRGCDRL